MPKSPEPDEFGRVRVRDKDTGHKRSVAADHPTLANPNVEVVAGPASDAYGDPLPVEYANPKTPVEPTTTGQSAETKEKSDG